MQTPTKPKTLQFISSFQGEADYVNPHDKTGRITYRWHKCPWVWGFERAGEKYWNYATEADFQREFNGSCGILHQSTNPVPADVLQLFQEECCAEAVTGYFNHETNSWTICEPTNQPLSTQSWSRTQQNQNYEAA